MLRDLLSFLGFTVSEATNGREALDIVAAEPPDLILMDLIMPVMDGMQAIRHIRQRYSPEDMPIIAISASAGGNSRDLGQAAGADGFLGKPVRLEELFACLEKHLKLEWLYETLPAQEAGEQWERSANLVPPPVEDLLALRVLAQGGRMTDLEQLISKISQTDQVYQPFVEQMSRLVDSFEFEEIMTRMDQYLETRQT